MNDRSLGGIAMDRPLLPLGSDSDTQGRAEPAPKPLPIPGRPRLLISACLLGERVRYDGQHKRDAFLVDNLGRFVEWVRVCPEADCGLGIPRPSMHLVGAPERPRLVARTGEDHTEQMERFAREWVRAHEGEGLVGYVCKKGSPSSGMERVKVYPEEGGGAPRRQAAGIFTRIFRERFPWIPVEEEGRMHDPALREHFIERVFCLQRWQELVAAGKSRGRLVQFHSDHKFLLLAHGRQRYEELGRLVAHARDFTLSGLYDEYLRQFTAAIAEPASVRKKTDVLMHMLGYFKKLLSADEKDEMLGLLRDYHASIVPLIVPVTLIRHYVRKHQVEYLQRQAFLTPYPAELMLRGFV
jgi:uncharacterized protein YbgA (DUF1722 family)/uncharacterized protein YbbK (DUF523 family)